MCLAEGESRNAIFLAKLGHEVLGIDSSSVVILVKAQRLAESEGVSIKAQVTDFLKEYDNGEDKWDAVVSIFAHLPPPLRKSAHERAVQGLKSGGVLDLS